MFDMLPEPPSEAEISQRIRLRAYELIKDYDNWCWGGLAYTTDNRSVAYDDPKATKFCLLGAYIRATNELGANLMQIGRASCRERV